MQSGRNSLAVRCSRALSRDWQMYVLCVPALIYILLLCYWPMYGVQIAFRNYKAKLGIWGSEWIGMKNFIQFYESPRFWQILKNTVIVSMYSLIAGMPISIITALLINQMRSPGYKRFVQTIIYAPYFISMVVFCAMIIQFTSVNSGVVNILLSKLGFEQVDFMGKADLYYHLYVWTGVWQTTGWNSIIYIAALSGLSPELYEAARIDGANRVQIMAHIEIPGIMPTILILFILGAGSFMNVGFQKAYLMQNAINMNVSEIIATYEYKIGLLNSKFSFSTAISLFNNVINVALLLFVNTIVRKLSETSLL